MGKQNTALLLTGAIDIHQNNVPFTRITNTQTRLKQYLHSIDYAIRKYKSIEKVVFVENTNYSYDYNELMSLATNCGKTLEILSFQGNTEETAIHGKGFGEIECINYALKNSKLLMSSKAFVKLTGRVLVVNFDCVFRSAYGQNSFYAIIPTGTFPYVETILYRAENNFFRENLCDIGSLVFDKEKMYLERVLYQRLLNLSGSHPVGSFKAYRFLSGISASTGKTYTTKLPHKISNSVYAMFRRFDINRQ